MKTFLRDEAVQPFSPDEDPDYPDEDSDYVLK